MDSFRLNSLKLLVLKIKFESFLISQIMRKSTVLLKTAFASGPRTSMMTMSGKGSRGHSFLSSLDHVLITHLEMTQVWFTFIHKAKQKECTITSFEWSFVEWKKYIFLLYLKEKIVIKYLTIGDQFLKHLSFTQMWWQIVIKGH